MPETDIRSAHHKLEALRQLLASVPIELPAGGKQVHITISAGIASFPEDGADAADLFAVADERMFQAKGEGRNRVVAGPTLVVA
jgi:diguanylate cyclase (GGDEF)-like protein